jgi:hypothetical protein
MRQSTVPRCATFTSQARGHRPVKGRLVITLLGGAGGGVAARGWAGGGRFEGLGPSKSYEPFWSRARQWNCRSICHRALHGSDYRLS